MKMTREHREAESACQMNIRRYTVSRDTLGDPYGAEKEEACQGLPMKVTIIGVHETG